MGGIGTYRYEVWNRAGPDGQAEQKSNGALPLNVRCWERSEPLSGTVEWHGFTKSLSSRHCLIEGSVCLKELNAAQRDGWAPGTSRRLPVITGKIRITGHTSFLTLLAVGVLATSLHPDHPLPVQVWWNDTALA